MKILHLNLKAIYFDQIKSGEKKFEYRQKTSYWTRRIEGHHYGNIAIKSGYPKVGDSHRIIIRPWRSYEIQTILHPHFGADPVEVYALRANE